MIQPTIGRIVWFQPAKKEDEPLRDQPFAAQVAYVHDDGTINIGYLNENGENGSAIRVPLLQEGDDTLAGGYFTIWMPYQVQAAAKDAVATSPKKTKAE